jgi:glycerol-3-phosphate cytidylyltransferase-like family protein
LHRARLAAGSGEELIAAVARDEAVKRLKGSAPEWSERKRMYAVRNTGLVSRAVLGDARQGSYAVLKKYGPDLICLGYDQDALEKDLRQRMHEGELPKTPIRNIGPYKPVIYHTSLRRGPGRRRGKRNGY